jgi:hypothetical protein
MRTSGGYWWVTERIGTAGTPAEGLPGRDQMREAAVRASSPSPTTEVSRCKFNWPACPIAARRQRDGSRTARGTDQLRCTAGRTQRQSSKIPSAESALSPDAGRSSRVARQRVLRMQRDGCHRSRSTVRVIELREEHSSGAVLARARLVANAIVRGLATNEGGDRPDVAAGSLKLEASAPDVACVSSSPASSSGGGDTRHAPRTIVEDEMLNGEVISRDGALRTPLK